jgi:hypothetical protein
LWLCAGHIPPEQQSIVADCQAATHSGDQRRNSAAKQRQPESRLAAVTGDGCETRISGSRILQQVHGRGLEEVLEAVRMPLQKSGHYKGSTRQFGQAKLAGFLDLAAGSTHTEIHGPHLHIV